MSRRVVVTGLGVITSIGTTPRALWEGLMAGRSGAAPVTTFDCSEIGRSIGCEIKEFEKAFPEISRAPYGRATQLAIAAAKEALTDAGVNPAQDPRIALCVGTTMSECHSGIAVEGVTLTVDGKQLPSMSLEQLGCDAIGQGTRRALQLQGQVITIPTACAAGNYAIGHGFDLIKNGTSDMVLAGGSDAFSRIAFMGFARLQALAMEVCRPFDRNRQGLLVSEGSAFLVLESWEGAMARGATPYAELLGYGLSCDGFHITSPHPEGLGAALAIERALGAAAVSVEDVDYISAHGTGTQANDRMETLAIKRVFGKRVRSTPVSSIKSVLGHAMGAASAIEAVVCCLALKHQVLPPTWNYQDPDPDCDLDYLPNEPRETGNTDVVISNSFAFGGNNACIVLRRV